ncbi:MAG: hypothetical protein ACTSXA_12640 [Candidatus Heimdallarchaeota archaeon]
MDKFKVMSYLLKDFKKYGITYPKKAKKIAEETGISVTETYLTLRDLQEKGLIWRVGKKYKYLYGLKEGPQLDNLVELYSCLVLEYPLPSELEIDSGIFEELLNKNKLKNEIIIREREEQIKIRKGLSQITFLSREEREETINDCISRIIAFYSNNIGYSTEEETMNFLKTEFESVLPILYCTEIKGGR